MAGNQFMPACVLALCLIMTGVMGKKDNGPPSCTVVLSSQPNTPGRSNQRSTTLPDTLAAERFSLSPGVNARVAPGDSVSIKCRFGLDTTTSTQVTCLPGGWWPVQVALPDCPSPTTPGLAWEYYNLPDSVYFNGINSVCNAEPCAIPAKGCTLLETALGSLPATPVKIGRTTRFGPPGPGEKEGTSISTATGGVIVTASPTSDLYIALVYSGYFKASVSDVYEFSICSDDTSILKVHTMTLTSYNSGVGSPIGDNVCGGCGGIGSAFSGTVTLEAGKFYPLSLKYVQGYGSSSLSVGFRIRGESSFQYDGTGFYFSV